MRITESQPRKIVREEILREVNDYTTTTTVPIYLVREAGDYYYGLVQKPSRNILVYTIPAGSKLIINAGARRDGTSSYSFRGTAEGEYFDSYTFVLDDGIDPLDVHTLGKAANISSMNFQFYAPSPNKRNVVS